MEESPCYSVFQLSNWKLTQGVVAWGIAFPFWHGFSLPKIRIFPLLHSTRGFKFSQAMGTFYNPADTIPEIVPIQGEPRKQVSYNREMLAGNHTEWN